MPDYSASIADAAILPATIDALLQDVLSHDTGRVTPLRLADGRRFWLKRVERLTLRLRMQKGDPVRSFETERAGLHYLSDRGLPAPQILREGDDYILLTDVGPSLMAMVNDAEMPSEEKLQAFRAAGRALAALHRAGLAHGRPAPRDICWDGQTARFIDLERFSPRRRSRFWQALDVLIFAQGYFSRWPADSRWLDAAIRDYEEYAPEGGMKRVQNLARRLRLLIPLANLMLRLRPSSRETKAIPLTLRYLIR